MAKQLQAIIFAVLAVSIKSVISQRHEVTLDEGRVVIGWTVNTAMSTITFDAAVQTTGHLAVGVSAEGNMNEADIAYGWVTEEGTTITDCFAQGTFRPAVDDSQDLLLLYGYETATHTYIRFTRPLNSGDDQDVPITNATTNLIWAYGPADNIAYHGSNRGSYTVNLLNP